MKKIAIITTAFPYYPGEEFIEKEIEFWGNSKYSEVYLLPSTAEGTTRKIPLNVKLDLALTKRMGLESFIYYLTALTSIFFYREIIFLYQNRKLNLLTVIRSLRSLSRVFLLASKIKIFVKRNGPIDTIYCYWNDVESYAACLVKRDGHIKRVITRSHGFDLYEETRKFGYSPLKRQFIQFFDRIYPVSSDGRKYLLSRFALHPSRVEVSHLGVSIPEQFSTTTPNGFFNILSVAGCRHVKRIDKIIDALAILASRNPELKINWTHIGDGPLFDSLCKRAQIKFRGPEYQNLSHLFKGHLSNSLVNQFYLTESIDVFINVSESEGVPVAIMEAMSYGVPAVAPKVGGIPSLINNNSGKLLSTNPSIREIFNVMQSFIESSKSEKFRYGSKDVIKNRFNAPQNYRDFIDKLYME